MQRLSRFKKLLFPALLFWFALHTAYTILDGITDKGKTADIALILGNKVKTSTKTRYFFIYGLDL
jgi:hypothetical protein